MQISVTVLKRNLKAWTNQVRTTNQIIEVTRHGETIAYFISAKTASGLSILTLERYTMDAFRCNLGGIYRLLRPEREIPDAVFLCDRYLGEKFMVAALVKLSFAEQLGVGDDQERSLD